MGNKPSICPVLWTLANGLWFKRAASHTLNPKIYQKKQFVRPNVINYYQESRRIVLWWALRLEKHLNLTEDA